MLIELELVPIPSLEAVLPIYALERVMGKTLLFFVMPQGPSTILSLASPRVVCGTTIY